MLLLWLYVVAVAVPRAADCTFMDGATSGTGKTKRPLRSKNPKNRLPSTLPLLSNNTVDTDNSLNNILLVLILVIIIVLIIVAPA